MIQDLRIGLRVLIKEKTFALLAVVVLALGICAVATQFAVVNGFMLRGFSFPNAPRLMGIQIIDPTRTTANGVARQIFTLDYQEISEQQRSFELLAAYANGATVNVTVDGNPQRYTGAYVTSDFFRILGVAPMLGRDFTATDNHLGAAKVALIGHHLWQRDFGANPGVVGRAVVINGQPATVIGVMPPGFAFPINEELWVPLYAEYPPQPRNVQVGGVNRVAVLGLIKPEVSVDQASLEFGAIARRLAAAYPDTNKKFDAALVEPLIRTFTPTSLRGLQWTMLAFCVSILLVACVNVMNMQFARATLRGRELAIRSSLGATRVRLIRQMLTESLLVATLGAVVGVALAYWATSFLMAATRNLPFPLPAYITFEIDRPVLGLVVVATMVSTVVSGFVPAWLASRANAMEALKDSGRGNTSRAVGLITRGLVVFQIMVTTVLLTGSLLQLQSILRQQKLDYGYDTDALLTARMALMEGSYPRPADRKLFYDRLVRELRTVPEFDSAALTNRLRMTFSGYAAIEIEGRVYQVEKDRPNANFENVTDGYFAALGQKLREGRDFTADDNDTRQPVAIVNAHFASKFFGNESAVGRRFRTVNANGTLFGPWRAIVGVVANVRMLGPFNNPNVDNAGFYLPFYSAVFGPVTDQMFTQQFATVIVRPRGGVRPAAVNLALLREVKKVDPHLPLYYVSTPKDGQNSVLGQTRINSVMFSIFGGVAVVLASIGLYGVMSFSVNQRTQEFGVRMALGADARRILRLVLGQGAIQLGLGLGLGFGLAIVIVLVGRGGIENRLFQISPLDPATYLAVGLLLAVVAFIATIVPARRAARVNPIIALRAE